MEFQLIEPKGALADFVYCFSSLQNISSMNQAVIFPNGKIDLIFSRTDRQESFVALLGLETKPKYTNGKVSGFFSASFHPLAIEYLFKHPVADIINSGMLLPKRFLGYMSGRPGQLRGFLYKDYPEDP